MNKQELIASIGKLVTKKGAYYLLNVDGSLQIHHIGKALEFVDGEIVIHDDKYESVLVGHLAHRENFSWAVAQNQAEAMAAMHEAGF